MATYHIKNGGNDSASGLSDENAWATITKLNSVTLNAGDVVRLKRESLWQVTQSSERLGLTASGSSGNPIIYEAYGVGADPVITGRGVISGWNTSGNWSDQGGNTWSADLLGSVYNSLSGGVMGRLWLNGDEAARGDGTDGAVSAQYPWNFVGTTLYVYATSNPATFYSNIEGIINTSQTICSIDNRSYFEIRNIDFQGGEIRLRACSHYIVEENKIGKDCPGYGLLVRADETGRNTTSQNIIVRRNTFDTDCEIYFADFYRRLTEDAIVLRGNLDGVLCYQNTLKNWGHTALAFRATSVTYPSKNVKIYDNFITAPDISYGRGFSVSCAEVEGENTGNEFYNNYIYDTPTQNQAMINGIKMYNNIIDKVRGAVRYSGSTLGVGSGLSIRGTDHPFINNEIYNNLIVNCFGAGIDFQVFASHEPVENNTFANNIVFNCGDDDSDAQLFIREPVGENTFDNNLFFKEGVTNVIRYRKMDGSEYINVSTFNDQNGIGTNLKSGAEPDTIRDNIQLEPLFEDIDEQDYRHDSLSPAIAAGKDVGLTASMYNTHLGYAGVLWEDPPSIGALEVGERVIFASTDGNTNQSWGVRLPVGKAFTIFWGDGENSVVTGTGSTDTYAHTYTEPGSYDIEFTGDWKDVVRLDNIIGSGLEINLDVITFMTELVRLIISNVDTESNTVVGGAAYFTTLTKMERLSLRQVGLTGSVEAFKTMTSMTRAYLNDNALTGDASKFTAIQTLNAYLYVQGNAVTWTQRAVWKINSLTGSLRLDDNNLSSTHVDNFLISCAGNGTDYVQSSDIKVDGNNASRTHASNPAKALILDDRNNSLDVNEDDAEIPYTATGAITDISEVTVSFSSNVFTIPLAIESFTFKDGDDEVSAEYNFDTESWGFSSAADYIKKYHASFSDFSNEECTVDVAKTGFEGEPEELSLTDQAVSIYVAERQLQDQILGMGCKIHIRNTGTLDKYDGLFATAEREHYVVVKKGAIKLFEGFVLPQVYEQDLEYNPTVIIPASNQLSALKNYFTDLLTDEVEFSSVLLIDLVKDILSATGLSLPIYIKNTLFSKKYAAFYNLATTCYDRMKVNREVYIDQDKIMDGYSILEDILKVTYSRLYYYNGKWVIDRLRDIQQTDDYKIYPPEGSTTTGELLHPAFDLGSYRKIAQSGHLEYSAGVKDYELILSSDRYDNLIDPAFRNIRGYAFFQLIPPIGVWQLDDNANVISRGYNSVNVSTGIHYERGDVSAGDWPMTPLTASFLIDNDSRFSFTVRYIHDDLKDVLGVEWQAGFRLRYLVGTNWRVLERDGEQIVPDTSQLYGLLDLPTSPVITTIRTISDIKPENRKLEISEIVNVEDIKSVIDSDLGEPEFVMFRLDIFPIRRATVTQAEQKVGNVTIQQNSELLNNVITGTLNTNFLDRLTVNLRVYDGDYVNYKNTLMLIDSESKEVKSGVWSDDHIDHETKLQYLLIHDMAQQYNAARHKIKVDLWLREDQGLAVSIGSIFTYDSQIADKKFVVMGYDFNVKMCTYRIYLREHKDYDNFQFA